MELTENITRVVQDGRYWFAVIPSIGYRGGWDTEEAAWLAIEAHEISGQTNHYAINRYVNRHRCDAPGTY